MPEGGNGQTQSVIQLVITLDPNTHDVQVSGPIQDRLMCYGMLALAQEAIQQFAEKGQSSPIVRPPPGLRLS